MVLQTVYPNPSMSPKITALGFAFSVEKLAKAACILQGFALKVSIISSLRNVFSTVNDD